MSIIVSNIRLPIESPPEEAVALAVKTVGADRVKAARLYKKAVDARHKEVSFVYSVKLDCTIDEEALASSFGRSDVAYAAETSFEPQPGSRPLSHPPVICGFGPAGIFAGLLLARYGYRPVIFERGPKIEKRSERVASFWAKKELDLSGNVQFGEGGAGAFSDGKLTTRIGDPLCRFVLKTFYEHGAPEEILYLAKPHIGTDRLKGVIISMREEILRLGGEIFFEEAVCDILVREGRLAGVKSEKQGEVAAEAAVFAVGHSARDTWEMLLRRGLILTPKPFSVGLRIEHRQEEIDRAVYGRHAGHKNLPPAEYQLSYREGERACYTFCMCPGGVVVGAASEEGGVVTNGMSNFRRDGQNANSAVVVSVGEGDFGGNPLDGVAFQRRWEGLAFRLAGCDYSAPLETLGHFLGSSPNRIGRVSPSFTGTTALCDLHGCLPQEVCRMLGKGLKSFGKKLSAFDAPDALLIGVETRTSSPVRIVRGENFEALGIRGLYPCGEGAGYAGGIMSAAVDGLKIAAAIMEGRG